VILVDISFLGVGVQRAGTTFVHEALSEHPEVCTPEAKELHFFDWHYDRGFEWYEERFSRCDIGQVVGEVTPDYVADPEAVKRIAATLPSVKLFVILRDPVDRAYSAYWLFKERRYSDLSFEEAVGKDDELLERGRYADQLEQLLARFDRDQLKVMFLDEMKDDDLAFVQELYRFLGVDDTFEPRTAGQSQNALIFPRLQNALRRVNLLWIKDVAKRIGLDEPVRRWHRSRSGSSYPPMDGATEEALRGRFRGPDERLRELLDRPIPWRDECKARGRSTDA